MDLLLLWRTYMSFKPRRSLEPFVSTMRTTTLADFGTSALFLPPRNGMIPVRLCMWPHGVPIKVKSNLCLHGFSAGPKIWLPHNNRHMKSSHGLDITVSQVRCGLPAVSLAPPELYTLCSILGRSKHFILWFIKVFVTPVTASQFREV